MISGSNEHLHQELEYTLLIPDFHSMQSGRQDTLEEVYAVKFSFIHATMPQKRMDCFRLFSDHLA